MGVTSKPPINPRHRWLLDISDMFWEIMCIYIYIHIYIYTQRMHSWRWIILSHSHMIYSLQTGKPHWRKKQWFEWIWHQPVEKCCTLDGWRPPSTVWQVLLFSVIAFLDLGIYYELTVLLGLVKGEAIKPASVSYHIYHETKKKKGWYSVSIKKIIASNRQQPWSMVIHGDLRNYDQMALENSGNQNYKERSPFG